MNFLRTLAAGLMAAVSVAYAAPVPIIPTGTTDVTLDAGFVGVLTGAGITPSTLGTATISGLTVSFPITGGTVDPMTGFALIEHNGSGLRFDSMMNFIEIRNFLVDTQNLKIFGDVVGSAVTVNDVELFNIGGGLTLTLTSTASGAFTATFGTPDLTGALVGVASTAPQVVPEPGTWAMMAAGVAGLALLRRRK